MMAGIFAAGRVQKGNAGLEYVPVHPRTSIFNEPLTMTGANRVGRWNRPSNRLSSGETSMGTVVMLAQARRGLHLNRPPLQAGSASVVILPVIRIEREGNGWSSPVAEDSKPRGPRRRRRTTRTS
jgi:hypothetical protein